MTRRLLASLTLATVVSGGFGAFASPAAATDDDKGWICLASENQRRPGYYQYLCIDGLLETAGVDGLVTLGR